MYINYFYLLVYRKSSVVAAYILLHISFLNIFKIQGGFALDFHAWKELNKNIELCFNLFSPETVEFSQVHCFASVLGFFFH